MASDGGAMWALYDHDLHENAGLERSKGFMWVKQMGWFNDHAKRKVRLPIWGLCLARRRPYDSWSLGLCCVFIKLLSMSTTRSSCGRSSHRATIVVLEPWPPMVQTGWTVIHLTTSAWWGVLYNKCHSPLHSALIIMNWIKYPVHISALHLCRAL